MHRSALKLTAMDEPHAPAAPTRLGDLGSKDPAAAARAIRAHIEQRGPLPPGQSDDRLAEAVASLPVHVVIGIADAADVAPGSLILIELYSAWIDRHKEVSHNAFAAWYNLGIQYAARRESESQIACYANAAAHKPDFYQASVNLGLAYEAAGRRDLALATWQKALQSVEARITLLNHSGRLLEDAKLFDEAERKYRESLMADPSQADVLHHMVGLRTKMCLWPVLDPSIPGVTPQAMLSATRALSILALSDDIEVQSAANLSWIKEKMPAAPLDLSADRSQPRGRIRIGYLSSDFCRHPLAYLITELLERHDRSRFEIFGYCSTIDDASDVRQRIRTAFDHFAEIRSQGDEAVARRIRADEIDVLIDLNGLTLHNRLQVLRWRPAPIQMTYLGYNGPVPLPELDYLIADTFVIPPQDASKYHPTPLNIPHCYQVNDAMLPVQNGSTRADVGLPADAFVFCSFSNTYKITEEIFDAWMRILAAVDGSVLWLYVDNAFAQANLQARAGSHGISLDRLIFASRVEPAVYRGRLALADLFLDTFPYNSGVTTSDVLRAGLPVVTLSGRSFISRMAGSLLNAMGVEDGVATTIEDYEAMAVALAGTPERYRAYRGLLTPERFRATLGNTDRFCRDFEAILSNLVADKTKAPA